MIVAAAVVAQVGPAAAQPKLWHRLLDRPASEYRRLRQGARDHTRANVDYAQLIQWRKLPVNWDS